MTNDALENKYAWLVAANSWRVLHYIPGVTFATWNEWWEDDSVPGVDNPQVTAACGRSFKANLPGIFSRMGTPRCRDCCSHLDIPQGNGAPVNDESLKGMA